MVVWPIDFFNAGVYDSRAKTLIKYLAYELLSEDGEDEEEKKIANKVESDEEQRENYGDNDGGDNGEDGDDEIGNEEDGDIDDGDSGCHDIDVLQSIEEVKVDNERDMGGAEVCEALAESQLKRIAAEIDGEKAEAEDEKTDVDEERSDVVEGADDQRELKKDAEGDAGKCTCDDIDWSVKKDADDASANNVNDDADRKADKANDKTDVVVDKERLKREKYTRISRILVEKLEDELQVKFLNMAYEQSR